MGVVLALYGITHTCMLKSSAQTAVIIIWLCLYSRRIYPQLVYVSMPRSFLKHYLFIYYLLLSLVLGCIVITSTGSHTTKYIHQCDNLPIRYL